MGEGIKARLIGEQGKSGSCKSGLYCILNNHFLYFNFSKYGKSTEELSFWTCFVNLWRSIEIIIFTNYHFCNFPINPFFKSSLYPLTCENSPYYPNYPLPGCFDPVLRWTSPTPTHDPKDNDSTGNNRSYHRLPFLHILP